MQFSTLTLYASLVLAVAGALGLTSEIRKPRQATQDEICRDKHHHICHDEECVPVADARCDGVIQCQDGSDEVGCPGSGCIIPDQPEGGSFQLSWCTGSSCDAVPGNRVASGSFLTYRCNEGYALQGTNITFCYINAWFLPPVCIKTCPVLRLEGVDAVCDYPGDLSCSESPTVPGTKATLDCKDSYETSLGDDPAHREITCLGNGTRDHTVFHCLPECGIAVAHGRDIIANGSSVEHVSFPWHVIIYKRNSSNNFQQICAGTLISPDLVISAAHCFHDETANDATNASSFLVAAGKYYRPHNRAEPFAQQSKVRRIDVPERYFGVSQNYGEDIALLHLEMPLTMTAVVTPICMDWYNSQEKKKLRRENSWRALRWGRTADGSLSEHLEEINLPYVSIRNCLAAVPDNFKGLITPDKSCAGHFNGPRPCDADSGGGLFFQSDGIWYLGGIIGVGPASNGTCDESFYTIFTNIGHFLAWIRESYFNPGTSSLPSANEVTSGQSDGPDKDEPFHQLSNRNSSSGCIVPEQPKGGSFELGFAKEPYDNKPGSRVPEGSVLVYRCKEGYTLKGQNFSVCYASAWNPPTTCVKTCPVLKLEGVDAVCIYQGEIVSCKSAIVPGTKATLTCKNLYDIRPADDPGYREITCLEDGEWDRRVFHCFPECGVAKALGTSSNVNGFTVKHRGFPWNVYIYKRSSIGNFEQICSGTLVSLDLVVSAAHCFYDPTARRVINAGYFTVAAGKFHRSYDVTEPYSQNSTVKQINVATRYIGSIGNHVNDIALIRLMTSFHTSTLVRPVCVDWDNQYERDHLQRGRNGMAVGSNDTELWEISYPYIPYKECVSATPRKCRNYITADKFCAGHLNESSSCNGSGGGGLYFQSEGLWYLRGVSSVGPAGADVTCDKNYYRTFTNVGNFREWIRDANLVSSNRFGGHISAIATLFGHANTTSSTSDCVLPEQPAHGNYELNEESGNVAPGSRVPIGSILVHQCDEGYMIRGNNTSATVCSESGWVSHLTCFKKVPENYCPALESKNKDVVCKYDDEIIPCGLEMPPGTKATLTCKSQHVIPSLEDPEYTLGILCLDNGTWDRPGIECTYECGTRVPDGTEFVVNGSQVQHSMFPWRVNIYKKDSGSFSSPFTQGVLISPGLVITWEIDIELYDVTASDYAIGASHLYVYESYDTPGAYIQKSLVQSIYRTWEKYGIVILRLKTPITMTALVRPICIDWKNRVVTEAIQNWATDETGRTINRPYIPYEECLSKLQNRYKQYLSTDTFCTNRWRIGLQVGSSRDHGDTFGYSSHGIWYLLGVYRGQAYTVRGVEIHRLTTVGPDLDWIRTAYNANVG